MTWPVIVFVFVQTAINAILLYQMRGNEIRCEVRSTLAATAFGACAPQCAVLALVDVVSSHHQKEMVEALEKHKTSPFGDLLESLEPAP